MSAFVILMTALGCKETAAPGEPVGCSEGSFGYIAELNVDEAGVVDVGQGLMGRLLLPDGLYELSYEYVGSDGGNTSYEAGLDGAGNAVFVAYTTIDADGQETFVTQSASFEGDLKVWDAGRKSVDGQDTLDYEQSWTYDDSGLVQTHSYAEAINGRTQDSQWSYDAQGREILVQRDGSMLGGCYEWATVYDDTLNTETSYGGVSCGMAPPENWEERRSFDADGRLLSIQAREQVRTWTWEGDDPATYTSALGSTRVFQIQDGVLVGASGEGELGDWQVDYDPSGRVQALSLEGDGVTESQAVTYSELPGGFILDFTMSTDGQPTLTRSYTLDELGNLLAWTTEGLVSGLSGQVEYGPVLCQAP